MQWWIHKSARVAEPKTAQERRGVKKDPKLVVADVDEVGHGSILEVDTDIFMKI
jgi:hypothetical protein